MAAGNQVVAFPMSQIIKVDPVASLESNRYIIQPRDCDAICGFRDVS